MSDVFETEKDSEATDRARALLSGAKNFNKCNALITISLPTPISYSSEHMLEVADCLVVLYLLYPGQIVKLLTLESRDRCKASTSNSGTFECLPFKCPTCSI